MSRRVISLLAVAVVVFVALPALAEGIPVRGRVAVPGGEPLGDADVHLVALGAPVDLVNRVLDDRIPEPVARTRSGADGRFELLAPHAGLWTVRIDARGFASLVADLKPLIEPIELPEAELSTDAGLLVRTLDTDGKPLAGTSIVVRTTRSSLFASGATWRAPLRHATTAEDGTARIARGESERTTVSVSAPERVLAELRGVTGTAATLRLASGKKLPLVVRSADGKPASGVGVALGTRPHPVGRTDEKGRITLHLDPARPIAGNLFADDGRRLEARLEAPPANVEDPTKKIVLPRRLALAGRLIDASTRRAIAGGVVWDSEDTSDGTVSDSAGGFALRGNADARMQLTAGAPGYLGAGRREVQLSDDGRPGPTLALEPAAAIEGQVVDTDGRPIADAEVEVAVKRNPGMMRIEIGGRVALPRGRTDREGKFRISPLNPEQSYTVSARAEGFAPAEQSVSGLEPYASKGDVRIELQAGRRVVGLVVDSEGRPVREVAIELTPAKSPGGFGMMRMIQPGADEPLSIGATDEDGRFQLTGLASGTFDLRARRRGFATRKVAGVEVGEDETVDVGEIRLEPGERVQGVVRDQAGDLVEGAELFLQEGGGMAFMMGGAGATAPEPDAVTDAAGWFALDDLEAGGRYALSVERAGYVSKSVKAIEPPVVDPLDVVLEPASDVAGLVLDSEGEPIAGAQVSMERSRTIEMGGSVMQAIMLQSTATEADGRFLFEDQEPGTISLSAVASSYREAQLDNLEVPKGKDLDGLSIALEAGGILEGRVYQPDGRPAIGARVTLVTEESGHMPGMGGVRSDGEGYYRLEGLDAETVSIAAAHGDYPRTVREIEVEEGINALDLHFEGGFEVSGTVVDDRGTGLGDATVRLVSAGRTWGGPETRSEPDGSFTMPGVQDGEYDVWVEAEGFAPSMRDHRIDVSGQPVAGLEVRLEGGGTIAGRILGVDEDDLSELSVRAEGKGVLGFGSGRVSSDGSYRIEHLGAGTYEVVAREDDTGRQARGQVTVESGAGEVSLDLEFGGGLTLSGTVVQSEQPLAGVNVMLEGLDVSHSAWGDTGSAGGFKLEGLEPGRYRLAVRNWQTGLAHDETLELATSREVEVEIPSAAVGGVVRDAADREPLAGVSVVLESTNSEITGHVPAHTATTDVEGRFTVPGIADGDWRLSATRKGYAAQSRTVNVQHGRGVDDVELDMDPTEGMTLDARLPTGGYPHEVRVAVLDATGGPLVNGNFATGESGRVRLSQVPAGTWEVLISAAGAATSTIKATSPGPPLGVALQPASELAVVVPELLDSSALALVKLIDSAGRPFRSLSWTGKPDGEFRMAGGRIEFGSLPPGSWTVDVTTGDGRSWRGETATSAASNAELVLE